MCFWPLTLPLYLPVYMWGDFWHSPYIYLCICGVTVCWNCVVFIYVHTLVNHRGQRTSPWWHLFKKKEKSMSMHGVKLSFVPLLFYNNVKNSQIFHFKPLISIGHQNNNYQRMCLKNRTFGNFFFKSMYLQHKSIYGYWYFKQMWSNLSFSLFGGNGNIGLRGFST